MCHAVSDSYHTVVNTDASNNRAVFPKGGTDTQHAETSHGMVDKTKNIYYNPTGFELESRLMEDYKRGLYPLRKQRTHDECGLDTIHIDKPTKSVQNTAGLQEPGKGPRVRHPDT